MYTILSALVFAGVSFWALKLLFSKYSYVKYSKDYYIELSGPEKFILFTIVTGFIACTPGGFSALRLMMWIFILLLGFIMYRKHIIINKMVFVASLFLAYILITFTWAEDLSFSMRVFLKYWYPILIMIFVMTFVTSRDFIHVVIKYTLGTAFILSILLGGFMTHIVGFWHFYLGGIFWPIATLADYLGVMSAIAYVMWWKTGEKKYLYLIVWFALSAMLQSVRTGLLSIGVMIIVASYLRYRLLSLPYIFGLIFLGLSIILFVPQVKEKMFFDTTLVNSIDDVVNALGSTENLNTSARSVMWEHLLENFYEKDTLLGQGAGSIQNYMYNNYIFGGLKVPHNDFVQMLSDFGQVGVILYLLIPISFILLNWKYLYNVKDSELNMIATIVVLTYFANAVSTGKLS